MSAPQAFLTETRERFLKAVVSQLPADRIRELYLFAPIRQGGVESGIAVIAAELPETVEPPAVDASPIAEEPESAEAPAAAAPAADAPPVAETLAREAPGPESLTDFDPEADVDSAPDADADSAPDADADSAPACDAAPDPRPSTPDPRYTVYTARYRHTQKGPDRGKWESSVVAEADAPLLSIETVVRGVQRRSGDVDPPDHMSGDELRSALRLTPAVPDA